MKDIAQRADILGALLFFILFNYFRTLEERTPFENFLLFATGVAFVIDCYFVYIYFSQTS